MLRISASLSEGQVDIPVSRAVSERLEIQLVRAGSSEAQVDFLQRLADQFEVALGATVDGDLRSPSGAQVEYAVAIARDLLISLPGEALRYRGAMQEFLDAFAPIHRKAQTKR